MRTDTEHALATNEPQDTTGSEVAERKPSEGDNVGLLRSGFSPAFVAAMTARELLVAQGLKELGDDTDALLTVLEEGCTDETTGEDTLLLQAATLDRLFNRLTTLALGAETVRGMAEPLKLAMRAQAQSRATFQAVSDIRHPRQYIGQQNVAEQYNAGGHQQVNRDAHRGDTAKPPIELPDGDVHELHPNLGTSAGGCGARETEPAVGALDGSTH